MPTFPSTIPLPLPVSGSPESGTIRTNMDTGYAKVRRRFTAVVEPISFQLRVTGTQFETLRDFFTDDTLSGSLAFDMNDPKDDVTKEYRFTSNIGWNLVSGASGPDDRVYDVTLNMELLP